MKRLVVSIVVACLMVPMSQAARQGNSAGQRRFLKLSIPSAQRPRLLLPSGNTVELSALNMEREASTMHLEGNVEIQTFWPGSTSAPLSVLRAESATYNLDTGEIVPTGKMSLTVEQNK